MVEQSGEFAGLAALVTGGASGIGLATARLLAGRGARVAVLDRVTADGESTDLYPVLADVTDDAAVRAAVAEAGRALGRLDIVVNNAGIGAAGTVEDNDDAEWHRVLDVNVLGIVRTTRAALPLLRQAARERGQAAIVNTCSVAAIAGLPQRALYSATKGAVYSLTLAMAADHVAEGIRVNCVTPGTADTPWVGRLLDAAPDPAAERAALNARQPMGRLVSADEVAAAIAYLASPLAGATTGTALAVDGGMQGLRIRPGRPDSGASRMTTITGFDTFDVRFPTSRTLAGSRRACNAGARLLGRHSPRCPAPRGRVLDALLHDRRRAGLQGVRESLIRNFAGAFDGDDGGVGGVPGAGLVMGLRSSRRSQDSGKSASRRPATRSAAVSIRRNLPSRSTAAMVAATAE